MLSEYIDWVKPKFHYADFPETSPDNFHVQGSFALKLPRTGKFGEVGVMEFGLEWTSRVCRGRHGKVGIVELGLKQARYSLYPN